MHQQALPLPLANARELASTTIVREGATRRHAQLRPQGGYSSWCDIGRDDDPDAPPRRSGVDRSISIYLSRRSGKTANLDFQPLAAGASVGEAVGDRHYLLFELWLDGPDASPTRLLHLAPPAGDAAGGGGNNSHSARIPLQFGRTLLANVLGTPGRAHWKACELPQDGEAKACEALREKFKPFDFAAQV